MYCETNEAVLRILLTYLLYWGLFVRLYRFILHSWQAYKRVRNV